LRDRREDIPQLCELFLAQAARDLKVPLRRLSGAALQALMNYNFPGNIRELRNLIERACILSTDGEITAENFPMAGPQPPASPAAAPAASPVTAEDVARTMPETIDVRAFLAELEKALIQRALAATEGAQAEAARRLGLSRSDLSYKLGKYRIRVAPA
jgi:DNA-binding NtrC family response regulator